MPMEDWIQRSIAARFLYDWQTLVAGVLAVLAAAGTIWATIKSANREIAASKEQTAVAQRQIETTLCLERRRAARESYAFHATIWAAMERVRLEASEAESIFLKAPDGTVSKEAHLARRHFSKGAFPELRTACVRYGGRITRDLLELEREIDEFASTPPVLAGDSSMFGLHDGFLKQLGVIKANASYLHGEAVAGMERATAVITETEPAAAPEPPRHSWFGLRKRRKRVA